MPAPAPLSPPAPPPASVPAPAPSAPAPTYQAGAEDHHEVGIAPGGETHTEDAEGAEYEEGEEYEDEESAPAAPAPASVPAPAPVETPGRGTILDPNGYFLFIFRLKMIMIPNN